MHVHSTGKAKPAEILKNMDKVGVDKIVMISPEPENSFSSGKKRDNAEKRLDWTATIAQKCKGRVIPFFWIDPTARNAPAMARKAVREYKMAGFKMIPDKWYPYEDRVQGAFRAMAALNVPAMFHSGILWAGGDYSRFCRPANYERFTEIDGFRFSLAHIGWPWTDETIAVCGMYRSASELDAKRYRTERKIYVDCTPGTPKLYRRDIFKKFFDPSLSYYDFESGIMFGTDDVAEHYGNDAKRVLKNDRAILKSLKASASVRKAYFHGNCEKFLAGVK